jgi:hypothetical protein
MWAAWSEDWALYDKVSFDGVNKIVYVHPEVTSFDIRADLYTSWIDWIVLQDNLKYDPMMRTTGLDPIGPGVFTGDVYFLINSWKLSINLQKVKVTGVLYSDDYDTAYYTENLISQYPVTVSALVNTVTSAGGGSGPTSSQIRQEIDNNSVKLAQIKLLIESLDIPTVQETATAVWSEPVANLMDKATVGGWIRKMMLTVPKYIGLK